ncbi:MAG: hypothetical protein ACK4PI_02650 [Tepidisphaerales bacterium]
MKLLKSPGFLGFLVVFQAGLIVGLVADGWRSAVSVAPAYGQLIPDPATVQMQTNELLRTIDGRLARIQAAVDGELRVRVTRLPDEGEGPRR